MSFLSHCFNFTNFLCVKTSNIMFWLHLYRNREHSERLTHVTVNMFRQ